MRDITKVHRLIEIRIEGSLDFVKDPAGQTDTPIPLFPRDLAQRTHRVVEVVGQLLAPLWGQGSFAQRGCDVVDECLDAIVVPKHLRRCRFCGVVSWSVSACAIFSRGGLCSRRPRQRGKKRRNRGGRRLLTSRHFAGMVLVWLCREKKQEKMKSKKQKKRSLHLDHPLHPLHRLHPLHPLHRLHRLHPHRHGCVISSRRWGLFRIDKEREE